MDKTVKMIWWMWVFAFLFIALTSNLEAAITKEEADEDPSERKHFNFASHQAGAVILDKSVGPNGKGFNHLLNDDRDKYGISPCTDMKWIVISLSEEISITSIVLANFEKYSSMVQDFQLFGSVSYPTSEWTDLGTYTAALQQGEQTFNITSAKDAHIRYLKIKVISHYEVESLCTLSQIKVYGITVFASLHQEVQRSRSDDLKHLLQEQESWQEVADLVDEVLDDAGSNMTEAEPEPATAGNDNIEATNSALESLASTPVQVSETEAVVSQSLDSSVASTPDSPPPKVEEVNSSDAAAVHDDVNGTPAQVVTQESVGKHHASVEAVSDHRKDASQEASSTTELFVPEPEDQAAEPVQEDLSQRVALINEVGDTEEVQVNASEWESFNQVLKDNNQSADSFVGIFKRFIDPISKTLDIRTLEKYIFSQPRTPAPDSSSSQAASTATSDEHNITTEDDRSTSTVPVITAATLDESVPASVGEQQQQQQQDDEPKDVMPLVESVPQGEKDPKTIFLLDKDKFKEFITAVASPSASTDSSSDKPDDLASSTATAASTAASVGRSNEEQSVLQIEVQQPTILEKHNKAAESPSNTVVEVPKYDVPDTQAHLSLNLLPVNISNTAINSSNTNGNISANGSLKPANKATKLTINCLEQLRFPEFQAKMIAKLQTNKNGTNGEEPIVNNKDNVFKQMMNRIKSLETNQLITEVYIAQTTDCFRVIKEHFIDGKKDGQPEGQPDLTPDSSSTAADDSLLNLSITNGLSSARSSNGNATNKQRVPGPNRQKNTSVMGLLSLTFSRLMFAKDEEEKLVALRYFVEFIRENAIDFWMTVCILLLSSVILFAMSALMICCVLMGKRKR